MNDNFTIPNIKEEITIFEKKILNNEKLNDNQLESLPKFKNEIDSAIIFNNKKIKKLKTPYLRFFNRLINKNYDEEIKKLKEETEELELLNSRIEKLSLSDSVTGGNKKHNKNIEKMYKDLCFFRVIKVLIEM